MKCWSAEAMREMGKWGNKRVRLRPKRIESVNPPAEG